MARKRALLIGINEYHPTIGPLRGCINDANRVKAGLLERFSFSVDGIKELYDSDATRSAILNGLDWLISDAEAGDVLVWFYSGHGTRLPNPQDPSGKDEVLVAFSPEWETLLAGKPDANVLFLKENQHLQFIRDKEIKAHLTPLAEGVNLTLIMDCCHSGDVNRDLKTFSRYLEPPPGIQAAIEEALQAYWQQAQESRPEPAHDELKLSMTDAQRLFQKVFLGNRFDFVTTDEHNILLAACSEKETALERPFDGQVGGVFTHHLTKILQEQDIAMSYQELAQTIGHKMRFVPQMPRLTCPEQYRCKPILSPF
jgi:hypothetical protein